MKTSLALVIAFAWAVSASAITIDTVPIGYPGNANDPATGNIYGGVNYEYNIGKYEVTVGQYTAFLNAVAATDTYELYETPMPGIARSGVSGSYSYNTVVSANNPVDRLTWADAARFANWLHNGQPIGAQDATTTEDGAYTLNGLTSPGAALNAVARNAGAKWFIPSESEWYKAAYYQPSDQGGDADSYWTYPMRTNDVPYSDQPPGVTPDNTKVGNFRKDDGLVNGYDDGYAVTGSPFNSGTNHLTDVGAYVSSPSYFGTFDQGGNVTEWNEGLFLESRTFRGGSYSGGYTPLSASIRWTGPLPTADLYGFRVANIFVPEPSTLLLMTTAFAPLFIRRRNHSFRTAGID